MNHKSLVFTFLTICTVSMLFAEQRSAAADLPDFGEAKLVAGGKVAVERYIEQKELRTITTPLPPGLKIKAGAGTTVGPISSNVMRTAVVSQTDYLELDAVVGRRINGDVVSPEVLTAELKQPRPVLILEEDRAIPLPISKLFAPDVLVLIIPPLEAPTIIIPPPKAVK